VSGLPIRYAGWMARDLWRRSGLAMLVVAVLAWLIVTRLEVLTSSAGGDRAVFLGLLSYATTVLILLATAGMVSGDFSRGYHRVFFARPVSPPLYYLQRWLLGGAAVVLAVGLVALGVSARLQTSLIGGGLLARTALVYLLLGGLVFLLSTLVRHDWLLAVLILFVHGVLGVGRSLGLASGSVARALQAVLPPFHLVGTGEPLPGGGALVHVALYGLGLVLAALAVLRWRPLAQGARE
jgi:ABC-type transport system involved in multi-copper enzyme maturation permease subunit